MADILGKEGGASVVRFEARASSVFSVLVTSYTIRRRVTQMRRNEDWKISKYVIRRDSYPVLCHFEGVPTVYFRRDESRNLLILIVSIFMISLGYSPQKAWAPPPTG